MTSWAAVRSENVVLGPASTEVNGSFTLGIGLGSHCQISILTRGWISLNPLKSVRVTNQREMCSIWSSLCSACGWAQLQRHRVRVGYTGWIHSPPRAPFWENIYLYKYCVHQRTQYTLVQLPSYFFFFLIPRERMKATKPAGFWKPPSTHWMINSTCVAFVEHMKILTICYSHF